MGVVLFRDMATVRAKRAVEKIVENGGIVSRAMIDAGYSPATAKTPQKLTQSKGFQELWEEVVPDKLLTKVHKEGLQATTKKPHLIDRDDKGRPVYDYIPEDDYSVRHKYLDTAYKLKGSYAPEKSLTVNVEVPIGKQKTATDAIIRFLNGNTGNTTI